MKKCLCNNHKGFTLVEVLAALVILGILFVSIMTIFPQMTLFNAKTEAKLDTMNLARQEMAKISNKDLWIRNYDSSNGQTPMILQKSGPVPGTNINMETVMGSLSYFKNAADPGTTDFERFYKTSSPNYIFIADVYTACEPYPPPPAAGTCKAEDLVKLHKVHLKVMIPTRPGSSTYRLSSETYSYIRYKEIDTK